MSAFFDDSHISDWRSSKGSGQHAYKVLNDLLGTPFSSEKRRLMVAEGSFLGLDFELSAALSEGTQFFVGDRLVRKVQEMVTGIVQSRALRSGMASKLMACSISWSSGCLAALGQAVCKPSKIASCRKVSVRRQNWKLALKLSRQSWRTFDLWWERRGDAAEGAPGKGTGGFHLVFFDHCQTRHSFCDHGGRGGLLPLREQRPPHCSVGIRHDPIWPENQTSTVQEQTRALVRG